MVRRWGRVVVVGAVGVAIGGDSGGGTSNRAVVGGGDIVTDGMIILSCF